MENRIEEYHKNIYVNVSLSKEDGNKLFDGINYRYCEDNLCWYFSDRNIQKVLSVLCSQGFLTETFKIKIQKEISGDFDTFVICRM
jgi:hypothetical protein